MNYAGSLLFLLFLFSTALTGHFWKYVGHGYGGKVSSRASAGPSPAIIKLLQFFVVARQLRMHLRRHLPLATARVGRRV